MLLKKIFNRFLNYFLQGLLYIAPIGITIWIIYNVFIEIDGLFSWIIPNVKIPGLGIISVITIITILGYFGKFFFTLPLTRLLNKILAKTPLIKLIYTSIKDLLKAFVGKEKKFTEPVLVRVNNISNIEKVGFLTNRDLKDLGINEGKVAVYFPHSYAFSGELYIVPASDVTPIDKQSSEVMKFIVSGGVSKNW